MHPRAPTTTGPIFINIIIIIIITIITIIIIIIFIIIKGEK